MKALQNEIRILKNVKHARIVSYYGSEQKDGYLHLFMDFMAGVRALMRCCSLVSPGRVVHYPLASVLLIFAHIYNFSLTFQKSKKCLTS